ncbi:MAG: DUF354 domain-containing protein, partial [Candidatus Thermoplasmatota archaeon]|nr:DUF354 domain-containing protein [Candidatus Thermoplasmatota archaeon]
MKIVVDVNHPGHVHLFKNCIWEMQKKGHEVLITASEKDVTFKLLDNYGFEYVSLGSYGNSVSRKILNVPVMDVKMYRVINKFNPDIVIGVSTIRGSHATKVIGKKCIVFDDSEPAKYEHLLYVPFAHKILTPSCFTKDLGKKHIRYNGYHELAYLHPNYFTPDLHIFDDLGLDNKEKYIIMRFVAWKAGHDINQKGFDLKTKIKFVRELEKYAKVYISSESRLEKELEDYRINLPPERMHHLLYFAEMLVGDSQTMTTEAALLGTPVIRCNSFVGENDMANFIELENKYGLIFNFNDPEKALQKAVEILQTPNIKEEWKEKCDALL